MKNKLLAQKIVFAVLTACALVLTVLTRSGAIANGATAGAKMQFALSLILLIVYAVALVISFVPRQQKVDTRKLTMAAMFAALCYVGFAVFKIDIPVGDSKTAFHLGNVFVVLGALFMGGFWGGLSGAVGLTIADLTSSYVTSAPKTFLLKLGIGLVTGLVAHRLLHISRDDEQRKIPLPMATVLSATAGMAFNAVADPLVGFFYKTYVLGVPQDVAQTLAKFAAMTTLVNAVVAVIAATILYLAVRPALKKSRLMPTIL